MGVDINDLAYSYHPDEKELKVDDFIKTKRMKYTYKSDNTYNIYSILKRF